VAPKIFKHINCFGSYGGCSKIRGDAEGWALYCEQMMLEAGLHNRDRKFRLAQLQMALLRACRYLVAIRMQIRGMTITQATVFFEKNGY
jgi:uncharacterized protein (DUF885 family)